MPYVNFKLPPEGLTPEKKRRLIEGVTALLEQELQKNPETTIVTIDEINTDNWGIGGQTVSSRRKKT
ncbi:MAG: 4-oxalocrotonate tautomerase family protein [Agarilytica sp.]